MDTVECGSQWTSSDRSLENVSTKTAAPVDRQRQFLTRRLHRIGNGKLLRDLAVQEKNGASSTDRE